MLRCQKFETKKLLDFITIIDEYALNYDQTMLKILTLNKYENLFK